VTHENVHKRESTLSSPLMFRHRRRRRRRRRKVYLKLTQ
jgi:hypothetical protein